MNAIESQHRPIPAELLNQLQQHFQERYTQALAVREQHGKDESVYDITPPDVVIFAQTAQEVAMVVTLAAQHKVPVIAYGAGSSLEGSLLAVEGGICLDVSRMNRILQINAQDFTVTVEPGITREELNEALRHEGLFFPIDPGANASIGGMVALRASGTTAVRYGSMLENVLKLKVIMPNGKTIQTGSRAIKSSAGYDLTRLFVGSAGTLGIITEITLRLYPLPEAATAAICSFPDISSAVQTVIEAKQMGIIFSRCEFMDSNAVRAVNQADHAGLPVSPLLIMEFTGSPSAVEEQAQMMADLVAEHGCTNFEKAQHPEERNRLWKIRHRAYLSGLQLRPGCRALSTDVCVPISRLADCVLESFADVEAAGLPYFCVGHVGDGNFHMAYLIDPTSQKDGETAERLSHNVVKRGLAMDGTCTGEHGIGLHKRDYLVEEVGADTVDVMRKIKHALDPDNILNPGKVFSWD